MRKKFRLLLLDANVVIELFRQSIWDQVIDRCDVYLSRTVAEIEAHFYETEDGERHDFDLLPYGTDGRVAVFDVMPSEAVSFRNQFDLSYVEKLDAGETESLAYLLGIAENALICSADKIVYRILGNLRISDRGVSLEEVLGEVGLGRALQYQFTRAYREKWTRRGFGEGMRGIGLER